MQSFSSLARHCFKWCGIVIAIFTDGGVGSCSFAVILNQIKRIKLVYKKTYDDISNLSTCLVEF